MAEKDTTARLRRAVKGHLILAPAWRQTGADRLVRTENNLFLVKRLLQRTEMRNPDPAPRRFTSLAWAAVLGHEETFEYLLSAGHDDEELSKVRLMLLLVPLYYNPYSYSPHSSGFGK
jgi:uncharacterized protein